MRKIRLYGREYLLVGDINRGGAIATVSQYVHGFCSHAHLRRDGRIERFGVQIGRREDIEDLGEIEDPKVDDDAGMNMLLRKGWHWYDERVFKPDKDEGE